MSASDLSTKSAEVDAVIAVHMFGNMCDMPALRQAAPGKPFIEDCAQSLGSKTGGISAGGFGDISVFSFHLGKYVSVGKGGALFARNPELRSKLAGSLAELPVPSHLQECIHVLNTLTRSLLHGKQLYGLVGYHLWRFYSRKVNYSAQSPLLLAQIYATDLDAVTRRLPKLKSTINRQRTNAAYYSRTLAVPRSMLCFEQKGQFFNRLQYPVLFPSSEVRDAMVAYMHRNHIVAGQPYSQIAAVAAAHHGYRGDCPNAERVARGVIVIPCNWRLQDKDRARVANSFNAGWLKISAGASRQVPGLMATRRAFPEPAPE
jgi:dTDP-4-amino-4,6-dideoxygalactose transaminase